MPTYPYRCEKCAAEFEREQKITDPPVRDCPDGCGGEVRRQIGSATAFVLNGPGWYRDGYSGGQR